MKQYNLKDYINLSYDKVLLVKFKNRPESIYGRIISTGMFAKPTTDIIENKGFFGQFNEINDFDSYKLDKLSYNDYTLLDIYSSEIEYIEVVNL